MFDKDATNTSSVFSPNKLNPIAVLREELAAAALCHGVERVEDMTEELVRGYVLRLGGVQVCVPIERTLRHERLARKIRASLIDEMPGN